MSKVYIVVGSSGSWEDAYQWNEKAFLSKTKAENFKGFMNDDLKVRKEQNDKNEELRNSCEDDCFECEECKWEFDYTLDEQHEYVIKEVDLEE